MPLPPLRRSPKDKTIGFDNFIGKHAFGKHDSVKVEANVAGVFECIGMSFGWKHDDHALMRKQLLDSFDWANEVTISRDEQRDIEVILESIS